MPHRGAAEGLADQDGDGIPEDGDGSGTVRDVPCADGVTVNCDDNCPFTANPSQADANGNNVGNACDPIRVETPDAQGNVKGWGSATCDFESGEVMLGIAYEETGSGANEYVDGFVSICAPRRDLSDVRHAYEPDTGPLTAPRELTCGADELVVGLAYRDFETSDNVDGATVRCVPKADPAAPPVNVPNADIDGSSAPEIVANCPADQVMVGVAYKDCNGGCDPAETMGAVCLPM